MVITTGTSIKRMSNYIVQDSGQIVKRAIMKAVGLYSVMFLSKGRQYNRLPGILGQKAHTWLNYQDYNGMTAAHFPETRPHKKHSEIQIPTDYLLTNV